MNHMMDSFTGVSKKWIYRLNHNREKFRKIRTLRIPKTNIVKLSLDVSTAQININSKYIFSVK